MSAHDGTRMRPSRLYRLAERGAIAHARTETDRGIKAHSKEEMSTVDITGERAADAEARNGRKQPTRRVWDGDYGPPIPA